jgi:hypothetical protein
MWKTKEIAGGCISGPDKFNIINKQVHEALVAHMEDAASEQVFDPGLG